MRHLIIGLNYGCEIAPVLAHLKAAFPAFHVFNESGSTIPQFPCFTLGLNVYVDGEVSPEQLSTMRLVATAFREGFAKGYAVAAKERD